MNKKILTSMHWLLLVSKNNLKYTEQRKTWNDITNDFRLNNKGLNKVNDHLGALLSLTDGVYQD